MSPSIQLEVHLNTFLGDMVNEKKLDKKLELNLKNIYMQPGVTLIKRFFPETPDPHQRKEFGLS